MNSTIKTDVSRINWLASLRGVAAFLVFVSHLDILPISLNFSFILGRIGVTCFFLITGYLSLSSRIRRTRVQYTINRFFRMYPVYWVLLILSFILQINKISLIQLIANMTYFEEFLGIKAILGASWMMPIQVSFFFIIMLFGVSFFIPKETEKENMRRGLILELLCAILAIILSILRFFTNKPFPTAFFLLIAVGILGIYIKILEDSNENIKTKLGYIIPLFLVFEISLAVSTSLSYHDEWIFYEIAYNLGIILFMLFKFLNKGKGLIDRLFSELGRIGFTFFLGAGIPVMIIEKVFNFDGMNIYFICIVRFILAFIFAELITWLIEKPILKLGKKLESKFSIQPMDNQ